MEESDGEGQVSSTKDHREHFDSVQNADDDRDEVTHALVYPELAPL